MVTTLLSFHASEPAHIYRWQYHPPHGRPCGTRYWIDFPFRQSFISVAGCRFKPNRWIGKGFGAVYSPTEEESSCKWEQSQVYLSYAECSQVSVNCSKRFTAWPFLIQNEVWLPLHPTKGIKDWRYIKALIEMVNYTFVKKCFYSYIRLSFITISCSRMLRYPQAHLQSLGGYAKSLVNL